ncbi:Carbonic anhydrase [Candidatus Fokinia solitaria]|uniref:Carbonic anhydrase n=1 Tax=Candidatus Fokinia solitaria TaxID=1802984 RepID=A0A2U8BRP0_9RICK|nr:carbonic anhydrase [Candidatus Fokinia solitaria]AWD32997.1 Carbonic anhydrase [Candidatus Fokinia solitaria]
MNRRKNIENLREGYHIFKNTYLPQHKELFSKLYQQNQNPSVLVISCSDSRVEPSIIMQCSPGEIFVIRNVANIVPPYEKDGNYHGTSAALEFGVTALNIAHILILGHRKCGGIEKLMTTKYRNNNSMAFLEKWMSIFEDVKREVENDGISMSIEEKILLCEERGIVKSIQNLHTFPWIKERVMQQKLFIHGWLFDIATGEMLEYKADTNRFTAL